MYGLIVVINIIRIFLSLILWGVYFINDDGSVNVFFFPYKDTYCGARKSGYSKTGSMILTIIIAYMTFYVFLYELFIAIIVGVKKVFDFLFKERVDK